MILFMFNIQNKKRNPQRQTCRLLVTDWQDLGAIANWYGVSFGNDENILY